MKEKIKKYLWIIVFFISINIVLADNPSRDRTKYYNDSTYIIADSIEITGTEKGLDDAAITHGQTGTDHGWSNAAATDCIYNVNAGQAYTGSSLINCSGADTIMTRDMPNNSTFNGSYKCSMYVSNESGADTSIAAGFQMFNNAGTRQYMYYYIDISSTDWACEGGCTNAIHFDFNVWNNVTFNWTLPSGNMDTWVNNQLSKTQAYAGISEVRMLANNLGAGTARVYFDDCRLANHPAPQAQAGGDTAKPRINASLNYTSSGFLQGKGLNMTANVSDETALSFCQFIDNQTLSSGAKTYYNKSVTGNNDQCSQNYTIRISSGGVINFTAIVNDTSNNINYTSQIIEITSATASTSSKKPLNILRRGSTIGGRSIIAQLT